MSVFSLGSTLERVRAEPRFALWGRVVRGLGLAVEASALDLPVGALCRIGGSTSTAVDAEVVGFHERGILLAPMGEVEGIHPGAIVRPLGHALDVEVGDGLLGSIVDGLGRPMEGPRRRGAWCTYPLSAMPPHPLTRPRITTPLSTGVRAIDGLLTVGRGQRIGVFAGSGVGKSVLMGMIARRTSADVNVIALLGERGREVREFIERDLGTEGLRRSVVVVATSDQPALIRAKGALVATAIAEYFRDRGRNVLLMVDSITRVAMAWREIGLAAGEPPTTKGYPPSVFAALPRLLERAGTAQRGSISGLYTVLVEGDDFNEPVADAARSVLDGHLVLSRKLAGLQHFPAIDVLDSVSRVRDAVIDAEHLKAVTTLLRLEATYRRHEDLITVGAYKPGADRTLDVAVELREQILGFLHQRPEDGAKLEDTRQRLIGLSNAAAARLAARAAA